MLDSVKFLVGDKITNPKTGETAKVVSVSRENGEDSEYLVDLATFDLEWWPASWFEERLREP